MKEKKNKTKYKETDNSSTDKVGLIKENRLFLVSILILLVSIIFLATALWVQHNTAYLVPVKGYPKDVKVSAGEAAMRVDSVTTTEGSGMFKAPVNQEYLIIGLTVKNLSAKPINVLPSTDTYLKDSKGNVTNMGIYNLSHPFRAGELLPGDQISGQLSYIVPKGESQKLYIDAIWSGGVIVFDVKPH